MGTKERIILCGVCSGNGVEIIRGYDSGKDSVCSKCKGSGRMVITTVITEKPYKNR
jgi:DnaJ-class molecular chaperone